MNTIDYKFALGNRVRNRVDGFAGVVTGICYYINGCLQYLVKPSLDKDGKHVEGLWLDEQTLELFGESIDFNVPKRARATAGGAESASRRTH